MCKHFFCEHLKSAPQLKRASLGSATEDQSPTLQREEIVTDRPIDAHSASWLRVDRGIDQLRKQLGSATSEEQFQAVGSNYLGDFASHNLGGLFTQLYSELLHGL